MQIIKMNISELKHPEKNVRNHSQKQIKEMARSLEDFEQIRPVVVDENNVILCGNGLVMGALEKGETEIYVLKRTDLTENKKKKLMIADNQLAKLGTDNFDVIEEFIKSLDDDFSIPGYDDEMIQTLIMDDEELEKEILNYGTFSEEQIESVKSKEGMEQKPVEQTYQKTENRQAVEQWQTAPEEPMQTSTAETQRYVICPCCGEKIYLE